MTMPTVVRMRILRRVVTAFVCCAPSVIAAGCDDAGGGGGAGDSGGRVRTEQRAARGFSQVTLLNKGEVLIEQTGTDSVTVEAEEHLLPRVMSEAGGNGVLVLGVLPDAVVDPARPVRFRVTVADLRGLDITGAGSVRAVRLDTPRLVVKLTGSGGSVTAAGRAGEVDVSVVGSGSFDAAGLQSRAATVKLVGDGGRAVVNAAERLDASVVGGGSVRYLGKPSVKQSVAGSGSVAPQAP